MRITKRLTNDEFDRTTADMRLNEKNCDAAKAVLVDGFRLQEVSEQCDVPKQVISRAVQRIWKRFLELQDIPKGWVSIRVALPPEEAEKVAVLETQLRAKILLKKTEIN